MSGRLRTLKQLNEERLASLSLLFTAYQFLKLKHKWQSLFLLSATKKIFGIELKIHSTRTSKQIKSWIQLGEVCTRKAIHCIHNLDSPRIPPIQKQSSKIQRKLLLAITHDQVSDRLWLWSLLCNPVRNCADLSFAKKNSRKRPRPFFWGITHDWTWFLRRPIRVLWHENQDLLNENAHCSNGSLTKTSYNVVLHL